MRGLPTPREQTLLVRLCTELGRRRWASAARPVLAKEDMSTDIQGDSSADAQALKESRETAANKAGVEAESPQDPEAQGQAKFDPEVADKSGKGFPHQTAEERKSRVASSTEGEADVKTREYTPKEGTQVYDKD